jgi:putative transposase
MIATLKAQFPLPVLLMAAGLARSTYFYHQARLDRPDPHAELKIEITEEFQAAHGRYGHRRVHEALTGRGRRVAKKTVLKLMDTLGLRCHVRRRRRSYQAWSGQPATAAPNILDRQFTATEPNTKWVTDITEFRVGDRKLYLSPVIDLFDRSIITHSCGPAPTMDLVNTALRTAITTLHPGQRPLVHSDQGLHYLHPTWRKILRDAGLPQSMSRRGNCLDNAMAENFFGHLKTELFHHTTFDTTAELTTALDDYIDWYNTTRINSALGGLSPAQYRAHALTA